LAAVSFIPPPKKTRSKKPAPQASSADTTAVATGSGGYQEEWIPDHHIKKTKAGKRGKVVNDGDEQSGQDTSGAEGKVRKGMK
jgi:hypothetical protein